MRINDKFIENKSSVELEELIIELMTERVIGNISPGEYRSKVQPVLDAYRKKIKNEKENFDTDKAYDRAMRGI